MSRIYIDDLPKDFAEAGFSKNLAVLLPEPWKLADDDPADIKLDFSPDIRSQSAAPGVRPWLLIYKHGEGLADTTPLKKAVCNSLGLLEIDLLEWDGSNWHRLRSVAFSVIPGKLKASFNRMIERAALLVSQALKDKEGGVQSKSGLHVSYIESKNVPLSHHRLWWNMRACLAWAKQQVQNILFHENWMIGVIDAPIHESLQWERCPRVDWIGPRSKHRYLADPFILPGIPDTVLCEVYGFMNRLGQLLQLELSGGKIVREQAVNVGLPGHLSFPFTFTHEGATYCMPESNAARRLVIFHRGEDSQWHEYARPLENVAAADAVLFEHEGLFWIAYTDLALDRFDNLNLVYAKNLKGPWQFHANNPVRVDPRNTRCGGTPFRHQGRLYRPAQDCSERYGGALRIMEVITCAPTIYEEKEVTKIIPESGLNPDGIHTLSSYGAKTLVDGKRMVFSPRIIGLKIWQRILAASQTR